MIRPFMALYLVVVTLLSTTTITESTSIENATAIPFPRVYMARVKTPDKNPSTVSQFPAEIDLLSFSRLTKTTSKITFLVHDQHELTRLRSLAKTAPTKTLGQIKIDFNATASLREQINYVGRTPRVASVYTTIADFPCYKNLQGSFSWLDGMVERARTIPGISVIKSDIGNSYLKSKNAATGYDMWVLKITGTAVTGAAKGAFFIMSGIHAREYAPPELASRWVESLINGYGVDADITAMLDYTVIHLVVQSNPDGRAVAETNRAAYRRKNVNPNSGTCTTNSRGVDLNRNFPFRWGLSSGSSINPCSITYRGKSAGSEPEVKAIVNYIQTVFPIAQRKSDPIAQQQVAYNENTTMGVFLDIHSYGNLVLPPWSYDTTILPPNNDGFTAIRDKVQFFTNYTLNLGYLASGTTDDYAYGSLGAAAFTFELGTSFYQDCATFENTIYPNNVKPLMYLAKISKAPFSIGKGPDVTSISTSESGGVLTITATASDSALSLGNVPTSKQSVQQIRVLVNIHPYSLSTFDLSNTGSVVTNGSTSVNVSSLTSGSRNVVYVQATDSAGYRGPVTAAYFVKN